MAGMIFSANSFCFTCKSPVIIPDSKFLSWSDFLDEQPAFLSVEPGKEAEEGQRWKAGRGGDGGLGEAGDPLDGRSSPRKLKARSRIGSQCVPTPNGKWTQVRLSEEAIKQLIQVIPNLPGDAIAQLPGEAAGSPTINSGRGPEQGRRGLDQHSGKA